MPRIFKGSESTLRLLIHKCNHYNSISDLKIVLFTGEDIDNHIEVVDGINVDGNMAVITLPARAFNNLEEGVINYIVEGVIDGDLFATERQSNYYLKTPLSYVVDDSLQIKDEYITENGNYTIYPDETYDGMSQVNLFVEVPDTNGSYDEGYNIGRGEGYNDGYANGQNDGYNSGREEVISQAESLYLTENGVYEGENLYNRVEVAVDVEEQYNKGYEDGANAASADAIVLDVTANGTYYTKYADVPEWNEPLTGDDFYSYAFITSVQYYTDIIPDFNTKIEFWMKRDIGMGPSGFNGFVNMNDWFGVYCSDSKYKVSLNGEVTIFDIPDYEWHHYQLSMSEGFWMDGVQIATYTGSSTSLTNPETLKINQYQSIYAAAGGWYGMIKINDNVIVPTDNGLLLTNNGSVLESEKGYWNEYTFYSLERPMVYNNLIKQVNVNSMIDVAKEKLKFSYSTFEKTPDYLDFTGVVDMSYMFSSNKNLKDLSNIKDWDTSKVTNMSQMFGSTYCPDFSAIKDWNVSRVTDMSYMFTSNSYITDFSFLSNWDTSKVTNMSNMLNVSNVTDLPAINCASIESNKYPFTLYSTNTKLVNVGGFLNMRGKWDDSYGLTKLPNLTRESCINILNGLYDFTNNSVTPTSYQAILKVHQNFLDLVGDEISIGTNKGWTITA